MNGSTPLPRFEQGGSGLGLASWYTAGRSDGFGDRLLMFDNTGAASLELLRFRQELALEPGFEDLLRQRVQRLSTFRHAQFATIRAVEHLEGGEGLALVSNHTAGKRLSELLDGRRPPTGLHPAFVSWLVQQITPLLAALQAHGYDIVHGALTAERIVLTADGRVVVVEHALGSALRGLELSPARLWRDFGISARPTSRGEACLDARGDIMQLGIVALSLLLGRRLPLDEVQTALPKLLDEFSALPGSRASLFSGPLRKWLERALQLHPQAYRSAAEAQDGLHELPAQAVSTLPALLNSLMPSSASLPAAEPETPGPEIEATPPQEPERDVPASIVVMDAPVIDDGPAITAPDIASPLADPKPIVNLATLMPPAAADLAFREERSLSNAMDTDTPRSRPFTLPAPPASPKGREWKRLLVPALAAIAVVEAAVIAVMVARRPAAPAAAAAVPLAITVDAARPGSQVFVDDRPAGTTPLQLTLDGTAKTLRVETAAPATALAVAPTAAQNANDATAAALAQAAARQRSGGVRFTSSIPLQVLEGERVLGTTADGPIVASAGTHQLDLVNTELGFRTRQAVTIRAGDIVAFTIVTPMGRLSVNAQPWAQVWVDQNAVGETPIANLAVTLGQHEVTFRHPQLGERKETVTVRADGVTRLSTTFGR